MKKNLLALAALGASVALLAGCGTTTTEEEVTETPVVEETTVTETPVVEEVTGTTTTETATPEAPTTTAE